MYSPKPLNLTIYDDQFEFEKNGICPHQWEISVPQKNCIIWGVVLSYLRSADFTVPGNFEERLNRLVYEPDPENASNPEEVKISILSFNPFFNIHKCFFDETLQKVSQSFKKLLNENRPSESPKKTYHEFQLISTVLKSNIVIVDIRNEKLHLVTPSCENETNESAMVFICREYWNNSGKKPVQMKRFTFSFNKDLCWDLRRDAFNIIMESSEIRDLVENEILQLPERKEKKVNILIALLKKNKTNVISELYDSSYIVSKLAGAGFETDPRVLDASGFSAFYYALLSNDSNLVYILCRYAATNCYEFVTTFREPNPDIIPNLSKLKEILEEDCNKSNNFENVSEKADSSRIAYQDLLRFNEFLTQVCLGINDIREKPESSPLEAAVKLRELIMLILDTYNAFFSVGQSDPQQISEKKLIENYIKHKSYYDNLDFSVALLFFDNIFLLKGVLTSPRKGLYSELESCFLLSSVANKYFTGDAKNDLKIKNFGFDSDSYNLALIPILERLNLREKVKNFCSVLREKEPDEKDTVERIPHDEIAEILSDYPILKDEFLISRLDHYMKTALETAPIDLKQKFVIQRALQVIGESIKAEKELGESSKAEKKLRESIKAQKNLGESTKAEKDIGELTNIEPRNVGKEHTSPIRDLLRECLLDNTLEILKKARNTLSHLLSFQFPLKIKIEEGDSLFTLIQSEIRMIREVFEKIFDIQRVWLKEFLINRGLESLQKFQQGKSIDIHQLVLPMENFGKDLRKRSIELECILNQKEKDENHVPNIDELCRRMMGMASNCEKKKITDDIPLKVIIRVEANHKLEQDLESGIDMGVDRFDCLFLKKKDIDSIKKEYKKYLAEKAEAVKTELSNWVKDPEVEQNDTSMRTEDSEAERIKILKRTEDSKAERNEASKRTEDFEAERNETLKRNEDSKAERNKASKRTEDSEAEQNETLKKPQDSEAEVKEASMRKKNPVKHQSGNRKQCRRSSLLQKVKKAPNPLNTLELVFEKKKVSDSQLKVLYEVIPFSDGAKSTLNSLIEISNNPCGDNLSNLLNRIEHLYEISIVEKYDIRFLWERAKSSKAKQHLVYKIVQRYFREPSFQASLEMLLFDCVGIFKKCEGQKKKRKGKKENDDRKKKKTEERSDEDKKNEKREGNDEDQKKERAKEENGDDQKKKRTLEENNEDPEKKKRPKGENYIDQSFWLKDSYLFNGIDVRNVLAHGDPLLESIGNILDPKDLPSELVKKTLQLLEDRECIEALCNLWQRAKQNPDRSSEWCELKKRIVCCSRWQEYSKLLAEDPKDYLTCDEVLSFLREADESQKNKTVPKKKKGRNCNSESSGS